MRCVTLDREPGCTFTVDVVADELPPLDDVDVLVANAGVPTIFGAAHTMDLDRWRRDLDVNLTGTFRVVQACLGGMRERGFGRIVVISSFAATHGMPAQVAYSASKAGLLGMVKTVAVENAPHGITANAILPGLVASAGVLSMPQPIIDAWLERIPTGRLVADGRDRRRGLVPVLAGRGQRHRAGAADRWRPDVERVVGDLERDPSGCRVMKARAVGINHIALRGHRPRRHAGLVRAVLRRPPARPARRRWPSSTSAISSWRCRWPTR